MRRAKDKPDIKNTIDSFYVLYVLSTGVIDDIQTLISLVKEENWHRLPLQIHLISIAPNHLNERD